MAITGSDERWENWLQYTQSRFVRTFTRDGYAVRAVPAAVRRKLENAVNLGLEKFETLPEEPSVDAIFNEQNLLPKFVHIGNLASDVMQDLLPLHEKWAGAYRTRVSTSSCALCLSCRLCRWYKTARHERIRRETVSERLLAGDAYG